MSASKRAREMSMHCPLTKVREGAEGKPVCATLLAPSKGCRVTVWRRWAAFTVKQKRRTDVTRWVTFTWPLGAQAGKGGGQAQGHRELHRAGTVGWGSFASML